MFQKYKRRVKAEAFKKRIDELKPSQIEYLKRKIQIDIDRYENKLYVEEKEEQYYMFFDMDMFYAACELVDRPEHKGKPLIVGGSVVAASNYEARKYGIRSAQPVFLAKKLCKDLVYIKTNERKYETYSEMIFDIAKEIDKKVVWFGLDEGCLHLNEYIKRKYKDYDRIEDVLEIIVKEFKEKVFNVTGGLTCSIGIAPTKYLAKLGTEVNKPNGHFILRKNKEKIREFLNPFKVRKLDGIGPVVESILNHLNIFTCSELRENLYKLYVNVTRRQYRELLSYTIGMNSLLRAGNFVPKNSGVGSSLTIKTTSDINTLREILKGISKWVFTRAEKRKQQARTITFSIKYNDFFLKTKSQSFKCPITSSDMIYDYCKEVLGNRTMKPIRLLGIQLTNFQAPDRDIKTVMEETQKELTQHSGMSSSSHFNFFDESTQSSNFSSTECFNCWKVFDFQGNNTLLNKHIDQCLKLNPNESQRIVPVLTQRTNLTINRRTSTSFSNSLIFTKTKKKERAPLRNS